MSSANTRADPRHPPGLRNLFFYAKNRTGSALHHLFTHEAP